MFYLRFSPASPFLFTPPKYTVPLSVTRRQKLPELSQAQYSTLDFDSGRSISAHCPFGISLPVIPNGTPLP